MSYHYNNRFMYLSTLIREASLFAINVDKHRDIKLKNMNIKKYTAEWSSLNHTQILYHCLMEQKSCKNQRRAMTTRRYLLPSQHSGDIPFKNSQQFSCDIMAKEEKNPKMERTFEHNDLTLGKELLAIISFWESFL